MRTSHGQSLVGRKMIVVLMVYFFFGLDCRSLGKNRGGVSDLCGMCERVR